MKKVAAAEVADTVVRLEHEAEVLKQLAPDSLGTPIMFASEGPNLYLVQPFVPGITL